ncbi:unnamed protein product [Gadus morhua 'NCC']
MELAPTVRTGPLDSDAATGALLSDLLLRGGNALIPLGTSRPSWFSVAVGRFPAERWILHGRTVFLPPAPGTSPSAGDSHHPSPTAPATPAAIFDLSLRDEKRIHQSTSNA